MALRFMCAGYQDVRPLKGGFDAWQEAGLPLEPTRAAIAVEQKH